jgi:RNA polymerase sigma-70 factor (ECF subfamily)
MNRDQRRQATEQIWRGLSDRLRQFVRSRIESTADVDDVLQTVFLRIHANVDDLRKAERLESWVFQVTRNEVVDHFRKKRYEKGNVESLEDSDDASEENVNNELAGCLGMLIERLPTDQRRVLAMYELDGVSQKEIAIRESISVSGAKSRVQRGRKSLARMLKECCEFQFDVRGNVLEYQPTDINCCQDESVL